MTWTMESYDWEADREKSDAVRAKFPMFTRVPHFECASGWNDLIEQLLTELVEIIPPELHGRFEVRQIKEKFGGLRFYYQTHWPRPRPQPMDPLWPQPEQPPLGEAEAARLSDIEERITFAVFAAESRSDRTCDICGASGLHRVRGHWHMTRCEEHADGGVPRPSAEEQAAFVPEMRRSDGTRFVYDRVTDTARIVYPPAGSE